MKSLRRWHLYLGVFFAPMLLFFLATGWYQTQVHERQKSPESAETVVQKLTVVHTDQVYPKDTERTRRSSPKAFQVLVYAMSAALGATTLLGIWLAFRSLSRTGPVWAALLLGIAVPVLLLWLGRRA